MGFGLLVRFRIGVEVLDANFLAFLILKMHQLFIELRKI